MLAMDAVSKILNPVSQAIQLPTDLHKLGRRPYGVAEDGTAIHEYSGKGVVAAIAYMQYCVEKKASRKVPGSAPMAQLKAARELARSHALDRLVGLLNEAIDDNRYAVTAEYLTDPRHHYSYEFGLFVNEYCRVIAGDSNFYFNCGVTAIPAPIATIGRPLGIQQVYKRLPEFMDSESRIDLRVRSIEDRSAILQWYGGPQIDKVPEQHQAHYRLFACQSTQGMFAAIPWIVFDEAPARVRELQCMRDGHECCEWRFSWDPHQRTLSKAPLLVAGLLSLAVLALPSLTSTPAWVLALPLAAAPLAVAWLWQSWRASRDELSLRNEMIVEQRLLAEEQYGLSERARSELQQANAKLNERLSELSTVNEIGKALTGQLNLEAVLRQSLTAVVDHLRVDRAMLLLRHESEQSLTEQMSVGAARDPEREPMSVDLADSSASLVRAFESDALSRVDLDADSDDANQRLGALLGARAWLSAPIIAKGKRLGLLLIDNGSSDRALSDETFKLMETISAQLASGIDSALIYQTLEDRVLSRTEELHRARLEAERASAAKSAFLASTTHEVRTPLNAIIGFTRIVKRKGQELLPTKQVENLDRVLSSAEHLLELINSILDIAKIEAGQFDMTLSRFDCIELIRDCVNIARPLVKPNVLLELEFLDPLPTINSNRGQLRQILFNLLSNAAKFTHEGQITLRCRRRESMLVIEVEDTGIGIAGDKLDLIFAEFQQADETITREYGGTGLGLAISRKLARLLGGDLTVRSESGRGTEFRLTLPLDSD